MQNLWSSKKTAFEVLLLLIQSGNSRVDGGGQKYINKRVKRSRACVPTPAVRSFCQCEILLIATHFQWGGACSDSVLAGGSKCHLSHLCLGLLLSPKNGVLF